MSIANMYLLYLLHCLDCVKDLIKSLRRENETCNIRRFLGQAQVLQEDLVPLIVYYGRADEELFEVTIRCVISGHVEIKVVYHSLLSVLYSSLLTLYSVLPSLKVYSTSVCLLEVS